MPFENFCLWFSGGFASNKIRCSVAIGMGLVHSESLTNSHFHFSVIRNVALADQNEYPWLCCQCLQECHCKLAVQGSSTRITSSTSSNTSSTSSNTSSTSSKTSSTSSASNTSITAVQAVHAVQALKQYKH